MNGWRMPDMSLLFPLAVFGIACAIVLAVAGTGFLLWLLVNHVQIVW